MEGVIVEPHRNPSTIPQIWNPNAAACWSLLFTPVFGALLHAANWRQLGQPARAHQSMRWVYGSLGLLLVALLLPQSVLKNLQHFPMMAILLGWYFLSAKQQVAFIKDRQISYRKRGWAMPLIVGFAGLIAVATASAFNSPSERTIIESLESESVELITGLLQEQLGQSVSCEAVSLKEEVSDGTYHGIAKLSDGTELPIAVAFNGRQISVRSLSSDESAQ